MFKLATCFLCAFIVANFPASLAGCPDNGKCCESQYTPSIRAMNETRNQLSRIEENQSATQNNLQALKSQMIEIRTMMDTKISPAPAELKNQFSQEDFTARLQVFQNTINQQLQDLEKSVHKSITKEDLESLLKTFEIPNISTVQSKQASKEFPTPNFQRIGKNEYHIENKLKLNWIEAAGICQWMGGYLASIENEDEMKAIEDTVNEGEHYWLGMHSFNKECEFVSYATGKAATVLHWEHEESYRCDKSVALYLHKMYDMPSVDNRFYFICQKK